MNSRASSLITRVWSVQRGSTVLESSHARLVKQATCVLEALQRVIHLVRPLTKVMSVLLETTVHKAPPPLLLVQLALTIQAHVGCRLQAV